ncbi:MAG: hypothetical protein Q9195_008103 [Heterodermia aff. obscurata]
MLMAEVKKTKTSSKEQKFISPMLARYLEEDDSRQAFRAGQPNPQSRTIEPRKTQTEKVAREVEKREG